MNRGDGEFLDTNVLVYAFSTDRRSGVAESLLSRGCLVSQQGLNEFANVARLKLGMGWVEIRDALASIRVLCSNVLPMDAETQEIGINIAERHGIGFYDALMLAAALRAGCGTFWSEDLQNGQIVFESLRIVNPFAPK